MMQELNESIEFQANVTAYVKHNFSRQHLKAAELFAGLAARIEARDELSEVERSEHRAYVTGAIVFAAAFLEASINELFLESIDKSPNSLGSLTDQQAALLAELWEHVEQQPVLGKYQVTLAACGKAAFEKGKDPYQGADGLLKIRNALIHYKPEWDNELEEHRKLKSRLDGRFTLNRHGAGLWFPHQCLGAGCAAWAADQAGKFMTEFCQRLGIPSRLP
jgi:hypothetical protein